MLASRPFLGARPAGGVSACPRVAPARCPLTVVAAYGDLPKIGGGRKWEHYELLPSGKAVRIPMHVKKGDKVQIISGGDKDKIGTITRVLPKKGKVVVEGVNVHQRHVKPRNENETGQIKQMELPIHHSNVMLYSEAKQTRSRVGHKMTEDGRKVRYLVKTGEIID